MSRPKKPKKQLIAIKQDRWEWLRIDYTLKKYALFYAKRIDQYTELQRRLEELKTVLKREEDVNFGLMNEITEIRWMVKRALKEAQPDPEGRSDEEISALIEGATFLPYERTREEGPQPEEQKAAG